MSSINISRFPLPKNLAFLWNTYSLWKKKSAFCLKQCLTGSLLCSANLLSAIHILQKSGETFFFYHVSTCFWGSKSTCLIPGSKRTKNESEKREEKCWSQNSDQGTQSSPTRQGMRAEFNTEENAGRSAYHVFLIPRIAEWMSWSTFLKSVHRNHSFSLFLKMEF